jgi:uncharacterized RDD family membrane protein YckC
MYTSPMIDTALPDPDRHPEFYADVPAKRLLAFLVDSVIIGVLTALVLPFTAFTGIFFLPLLVTVISFVYRTLTISGGSATWGMRLASIELRTRHGERLDPGTAMAHTLVYSVVFSTLLPQLLSIALMIWTPRRQGLPDLLLGTAAINRAARV